MQEEVTDLFKETVENSAKAKKAGLKFANKREWGNTGNFKILKGLTQKASIHYNFQSGYVTLGERTYWYSDKNFESQIKAVINNQLQHALS